MQEAPLECRSPRGKGSSHNKRAWSLPEQDLFLQETRELSRCWQQGKVDENRKMREREAQRHKGDRTKMNVPLGHILKSVLSKNP